MSVIMILRGDPLGGSTPYDNQYLKGMDFEAHDGQGEVTMTMVAGKAKRFADMAEAWEFWRTQPKVRPIRADGHPNRPLTATNWEFVTVED